ncbi:MAG: DUF2946 family protein [Pseudoxanthomonas sp.]
MLRRRRFLLTMHRLALMGALLMAVAPLVSRWVQAQVPAAAEPSQAMCHGMARAMQAMAMPAMSHAGSAMDMSGTVMDHEDGLPMPAGHDGAACDYCVLAAGLLPFVLVLLLLPLLRPAVVRLSALLVPPRTAFPWPAHAARGPPCCF